MRRWCRHGCSVRREAGGGAAAAFAGRVLGTDHAAALIAATALLALLMPLVITVLAPGFAGHRDAAARRRPMHG